MIVERRHRTLRRLMIAVALIGVGLAAVLRPNRGWALALLVLFLTMLLTAILGAAMRRGRVRAYWIGFALFGWTYLGVIHFHYDEMVINNPISTERLIKRPLVEVLDFVMVLGDGARTGERLAGIAGDLARADDSSRCVVAWSLVGLLFAGAGGVIALRFARDDPTANG
jgi:hypothetical protein